MRRTRCWCQCARARPYLDARHDGHGAELDEIVQGVAERGGDRFAYDSYCHLPQMFGDVVVEIPHDDFEA
ncbi:hypothetical protein V7S43_005789 [Phytophthora oleae]|uniref:Uncharacterized protein n=1 Tax=Phytophthora oleae TaxID=2107226 RepID=A0ABD3FR93_9STRA